VLTCDTAGVWCSTGSSGSSPGGVCLACSAGGSGEGSEAYILAKKVSLRQYLISSWQEDMKLLASSHAPRTASSVHSTISDSRSKVADSS
jgi:hypothetical protein